MVITKEKLQERKTELEAQIQQLMDNYNAHVGALQDCNYWLAELEKPETLSDSPSA